jgi:hypothetical protein
VDLQQLTFEVGYVGFRLGIKDRMRFGMGSLMNKDMRLFRDCFGRMD